ncbi:pseudouridine synthase [Basidiobolus meristosporus CBS 931.73]|uniref:Pseudouridine synthase n=1 Tax=Basidiobolus meristosporus CBS 931.73 TaxID=1314790 RepID=A0A1Y1YSF9_9FUNG|nr:pseudouridine synthase [Basidiobolus meristosporus CBS 931.73]|eukprot:ORY00764.1 pseudouridine synthase [Basidiobolus meristosporus CBS 931.73]
MTISGNEIRNEPDAPVTNIKFVNDLSRLLMKEKGSVLVEEKLPVIFLNERFLIVDKPANLRIDWPNPHKPRAGEVIPANDENTPALEREVNVSDLLQSNFPELFPNKHPYLVHQLDYATSGILCFALNKPAARDISKLFDRRLTKKTYLALVQGVWDDDKVLAHSFVTRDAKPGWFYIDLAIGKNREHRIAMTIDPSESDLLKESQTRVKPLMSGYLKHPSRVPVTLVKLKPFTGRTHQLRVHLRAIDHSIVGDLLYEEPIIDPFPGRLMLHAHKLRLPFQNDRPIVLNTKNPFEEWLEPIDPANNSDLGPQ